MGTARVPKQGAVPIPAHRFPGHWALMACTSLRPAAPALGSEQGFERPLLAGGAGARPAMAE